MELQEFFREHRRVALAFSGGVDSTFLLQAAKDVLGDGVIALTAVSDFFPDRARREADAFCRERGNRFLHRQNARDFPMWRRAPTWMILGIIVRVCRRSLSLGF